MPEGPPILNVDESQVAPKPLNGHDREPVQVYPAGDYQIIRLINNNDLSRQLFPKFVVRALGFIDRMNVETDKIWLGNLLYAAFANRFPHVLMLVALDQQGEIVAHCIAFPEVWGTLGYIGHILQIEKNKGLENDAEILKVGMPLIEEWARSLGLKVMLNQTNSLALARFFGRFGFEQYRYVTRKELD